MTISQKTLDEISRVAAARNAGSMNIEPGYCKRCGHKLAGHAEAGICTFQCDCMDTMCGCDRSDLS